ncbi:MAG: MaoC family dehydratase N-terminal domain-containing protein [Burkholderiales bacterium]|nr:MaoC family dehydratase N-terminal domain-containing protein [Burkholderiales bacterium]
MADDITYLRQWLNRTEVFSDQVAATPIASLAATLDRDDPAPQAGDDLPSLWHWLYFLPRHRHSELGRDGHPKRGDFLPPVQLPRRMWAGGRLEFHHPLRVGDVISRTSRIADVTSKQGRAGPLVFVRVRHEINKAAGLALSEEHDIVYRGEPRGQDPVPREAPVNHDWTRQLKADEVLLFRYSALTFNGHRIHYDRRYATETEGYPGLVVHGPLIATLLIDLLRRQLPEAALSRFAFRAVKPLFDDAPFLLCGRQEDDGKIVRLWAKDAQGRLAMEATATLQ